jgi:hypothetical protein
LRRESEVSGSGPSSIRIACGRRIFSKTALQTKKVLFSPFLQDVELPRHSAWSLLADGRPEDKKTILYIRSC